MIRILSLSLLLLLVFATHASAGFDYELYTEFLDTYVRAGKSIDGIGVNAVDYAKLARDSDDQSSVFPKLLDQIDGFNPATLETIDEKAAFWINVYNIGAINLVLKHYPVDSIRSSDISFFRSPWGKDAISVNGREYSLGEIEHDILLDGLDYPMAHFGVVCASVSCANLRPEPYSPDTLMEQLEDAARAFINDTKKGVRLDRVKSVVYVSKIFDWGEKDMVKIGGIPGLLNRYLKDPDARAFVKKGDYKVEYLEYNWKLNDTRFVK